MGTTKQAYLFFVSGIFGYLFGACCNDNLAVGCTPGVFGLMAALFGNVILNWKAMHVLDSWRFGLIVLSLAFFGICLLITY